MHSIYKEHIPITHNLPVSRLSLLFSIISDIIHEQNGRCFFFTSSKLDEGGCRELG